MPQVFKVKNYFVSNTNIPQEIVCKIKKEELLNDEGYHILLNPDEEWSREMLGDLNSSKRTPSADTVL
jgi:hypothetical protein